MTGNQNAEHLECTSHSTGRWTYSYATIRTVRISEAWTKSKHTGFPKVLHNL